MTTKSSSGKTVYLTESTTRTSEAEARRILDLNGGDRESAIKTAEQATFFGRDRTFRGDVVGWIDELAR